MSNLKVRTKKIYLNKKKTHWCIVRLFKRKKDMQDYYKKYDHSDFADHYKSLGVSLHQTNFKTNGKKFKYVPKTGEVLLNLEYCGAGIVSHEFMHAVLWSYKHSANKKQYPIVIKDMAQEEEILHNLTEAVRNFYNWYWKIKNKI